MNSIMSVAEVYWFLFSQAIGWNQASYSALLPPTPFSLKCEAADRSA